MRGRVKNFDVHGELFGRATFRRVMFATLHALFMWRRVFIVRQATGLLKFSPTIF